ncbi:MAG: replication-associated recombination protein A [Acidobacteriota bacterium]|nr:replication-associated recombination protein A [Acidobacteriota bacterium]
MGLFDLKPEAGEREGRRPLADRMRPQELDEMAGQAHLLGSGKPLRRAIENDEVSSMILWGPPGSGKTTLASIMARKTRSDFVRFSAVLSGIKEIREVMAAAANARRLGRRTILFVDEIHRFNKAQQDAFLPYVERGDVVLIGATTENPSFEVNSALLSRLKVYLLSPLATDEVEGLLRRALCDPVNGLGDAQAIVSDAQLRQIAIFAGGDARSAFNTLEAALAGAKRDEEGRSLLTDAALEDAIQRKILLYDKAGEEHYNIISALHKSVRNSDPDAALYWLGRMLEAGEDPLYIARRLIRMASEDIGVADPRALELAVAAMQAVHFSGMPEGDLALAETAVYLALAPKSNAIYAGYSQAREDAQKDLAEPVPLHLRNPVTGLMANFGYGKGYQYAHNAADRLTNMTCLPANLRDRRYYRPSSEGLEKRIKERLEGILEWKRKHSEKKEEEAGD